MSSRSMTVCCAACRPNRSVTVACLGRFGWSETTCGGMYVRDCTACVAFARRKAAALAFRPGKLICSLQQRKRLSSSLCLVVPLEDRMLLTACKGHSVNFEHRTHLGCGRLPERRHWDG